MCCNDYDDLPNNSAVKHDYFKPDCSKRHWKYSSIFQSIAGFVHYELKAISSMMIIMTLTIFKSLGSWSTIVTCAEWLPQPSCTVVYPEWGWITIIPLSPCFCMFTTSKGVTILREEEGTFFSYTAPSDMKAARTQKRKHVKSTVVDFF